MSERKTELCDEHFDTSYTGEGDQHCIICALEKGIAELEAVAEAAVRNHELLITAPRVLLTPPERSIENALRAAGYLKEQGE